ncbi:MAG: hypothetical protein DCC52_08725 [Chloroflexi bacterium]|nr:MAG: hypothetical protein DCC52_08725 [Chloroflexota bacterium]
MGRQFANCETRRYAHRSGRAAPSCAGVQSARGPPKFLNGKRIYHTGDTDPLPEMKNIQCDILLVPVSGTYVCTAEEAVQIAQMVKPALAIPMHWDTIVGSWQDANDFKQHAGVPVEILGKTS